MTKINQLILEWPKGTVKSTSELNELGYSSQILKVYANSGWINLLARGAYKLSGDITGWQGGLYCLQQQPDNYIHVGAITALELKGFSHFISQQQNKIELFGSATDKLPQWYTKQQWMQDLKFFGTNVFRYDNPVVFSTATVNNLPLKISSPELAILEMLFLVPKIHSFDNAGLIMESLTTLRGDVLQILLENCNSIKTKRLFLYLAEKHRHGWFNELNHTKINLGSGKREIVKNGRLNKRYNITIPKDYE
ncbi:MAG: type IV toxin-antitoxin system AbiEi family antitoxin domain-containing protein [bacterium]